MSCYSRDGARLLAELVKEPAFRALRIYEPGDKGVLQRYLRKVPVHVRTSYFPDVEPGGHVNGVRCEDLMALTFPAGEFDLVITHDVMEHVRRPRRARRDPPSPAPGRPARVHHPGPTPDAAEDDRPRRCLR